MPFPNSVEVPPKVPSLVLLSWWEHASPWGFVTEPTISHQSLQCSGRSYHQKTPEFYFLSLPSVPLYIFNWCAHSGGRSLVCLSWLLVPGWACSRGPPSLSCRLLPCNRGDAGLIAGPLRFCVAPLIYTAGLNFEGVSDLPRSRLTIGTRCFLVNTCTF